MSVNYNPNKNSIKIWPYQDDMSQAIINYSDTRLSKERNTIVNLDFSGVKKICSSGAVILLHKIITPLSGKKRTYRPIMPEDEKISQFLQDSGVMSILNSKLDFVSHDLFESIEINKARKVSKETDNDIVKISSPIYQLAFNENDDREHVNDIADKVVDLLMDCNLPHGKLKVNVFISVITEILKNAQDHTESDSFFGIDIVRNDHSNHGEIIFACSDFGVGIYANVRNKLKLIDSHLRSSASEHISFTDAYKFAFTIGKTTSRKTRNKGVGMSMIMDGANELQMDLSIWDGRSMLGMPKANTHSELRKKAIDTGSSVGFYYYGRLKY